jgi:hypothetical protein
MGSRCQPTYMDRNVSGLCGRPEAPELRVSGERRSRMSSLHDLLVAQSPRLTPRAVPLVSTLICVGAGALFLALLAPTFLRQGLAVWSVGIAYILYDTFLLGFTATRIAGLKRDDEDAPAAALRPSLAVIVAAHNEAGVLDATLERLATQDDAPDLVRPAGLRCAGCGCRMAARRARSTPQSSASIRIWF